MSAPAALEKSYYSADQSPSLSQLDNEKITQIVHDLDVAESEKEHYVTGWMGQNSVVLVRNYQDKRGTSNGLVLSRGGRYKLTIQAITFRIPKVLLWVTFRRKPRTMTVIAYNKLGEQATGLQQFMHVQDPELREKLEQDWRELNDYLGMACWQMDNNRPQWRQLQAEITPQALLTLAESPWFGGKKRQKDGEFEGLWLHEHFIGRRSGEHAALLLSWKDEENDNIASYMYERMSATTIRVMLRPRKDEKFYPLNPFDAVHLQQALAKFYMAERALSETQHRA